MQTPIYQFSSSRVPDSLPRRVTSPAESQFDQQDSGFEVSAAKGDMTGLQEAAEISYNKRARLSGAEGVIDLVDDAHAVDMYVGRDEDEDEEQGHSSQSEVSKVTNAESSTRKKKSIVWQYFSKVEVNERGLKVSKVRCSICGTLLPDSSTTKSGSSTGKYRQHLKTHMIQNSTHSRQSIFDVGELFNRRPNTPSVIPTSSNITALVEANIVKWMVATGKPFTEVESEYFQAIFKCIPGVDPLFKSASTATTRILELYMEQKSQLRSELATTAISVSISIDGWTSPTKCANVCDYRALDYGRMGTPRSCFAYCRIKRKSHWNVAVTSDNASNNAALIQRLERSLVPNLVSFSEDSADELSDSEITFNSEVDEHELEPNSSIPAKSDDNSLRAIVCAVAVEDHNMDGEKNVPNPASVPNQILFRGSASWIRCLAHSLNLVVKEVLNGLGFRVAQNVDNDDVEILEPSTIVSKIRRAAKSIANQPKSREAWFKLLTKFGLNSKVIPYDVSTRWNSTYYMIKAAHEMKRPYERFAAETMSSCSLNRDEWQVVGELQEILGRFERWMLMASANNTISSMWPILRSMDVFFRILPELDNVDGGPYSPNCTRALLAGKAKFEEYHERYLCLDLYETAMSL
ncbi:ribonuclease H-like domain-containing protein, partial [Lipomyces kononenkoae]